MTSEGIDPGGPFAARACREGGCGGGVGGSSCATEAPCEVGCAMLCVCGQLATYPIYIHLSPKHLHYTQHKP